MSNSLKSQEVAPEPITSGTDARPTKKVVFAPMDLAERFALIVLLVIMIVFFAVREPAFFSQPNMQVIALSQSMNIVVAVALLVPLVAGNFDLSVGAVAVGTSVLAAKLMSTNGWDLLPVIVATLAVGVLIGLINGLLVAKVGVDGLVATLGTSTIIAGIVQWYSENQAIASGISDNLTEFAQFRIANVPALALLGLLVAAIVGFVLGQTPFGRKLFAIGSNPDAATLVGIRVARLTISAYVISGLLAAVAGIMLLAAQGSGNPSANGIAVLLPALAAVFLGSSTLFPGRFNVTGTLFGLLFVAVLVSGLTLAGVAAWVAQVANGVALVAAVAASAVFRRQRMRPKREG